MPTNKEQSVKNWLYNADEDIKSAKIMLKAGRYTWCAFICQQAIEKCLKAGYTKKENKIPPYIHKLERLCQILDINPPEEIMNSIIEIDKYYIATRYPAYKESVNISDRKKAENLFISTKRAYEWLLQELKLKKI